MSLRTPSTTVRIVTSAIAVVLVAKPLQSHCSSRWVTSAVTRNTCASEYSTTSFTRLDISSVAACRTHISRCCQCGNATFHFTAYMDLAAAMVASTIFTYAACISCSTRTTPEIAVTVLCSTNRAHVAMQSDKPKGDSDLRISFGDAERARAAAIPREYATLGARLTTVKEPPSNLPSWHMEDAVSESAVPATNCELAFALSPPSVFRH